MKGTGKTDMHLAIDGYGADPEKLKDEDLISRFLDEYPSSIGMTKIIPPQVYNYHGKTPEDWGISGFVLIAESHISVHTFPARRHVNIDIFSCKDFDTEMAVAEIERTFGISETKAWTLERGLDYETPREAYSSMVRERVRLQPGARATDAG